MGLVVSERSRTIASSRSSSFPSTRRSSRASSTRSSSRARRGQPALPRVRRRGARTGTLAQRRGRPRGRPLTGSPFEGGICSRARLDALPGGTVASRTETAASRRRFLRLPAGGAGTRTLGSVLTAGVPTLGFSGCTVARRRGPNYALLSRSSRLPHFGGERRQASGDYASSPTSAPSTSARTSVS